MNIVNVNPKSKLLVWATRFVYRDLSLPATVTEEQLNDKLMPYNFPMDKQLACWYVVFGFDIASFLAKEFGYRLIGMERSGMFAETAAPRTFAIGQRVIHKMNNNEWYVGTVVKLTPKNVFVNYDDGFKSKEGTPKTDTTLYHYTGGAKLQPKTLTNAEAKDLKSNTEVTPVAPIKRVAEKLKAPATSPVSADGRAVLRADIEAARSNKPFTSSITSVQYAADPGVFGAVINQGIHLYEVTGFVLKSGKICLGAINGNDVLVMPLSPSSDSDAIIEFAIGKINKLRSGHERISYADFKHARTESFENYEVIDETAPAAAKYRKFASKFGGSDNLVGKVAIIKWSNTAYPTPHVIRLVNPVKNEVGIDDTFRKGLRFINVDSVEDIVEPSADKAKPAPTVYKRHVVKFNNFAKPFGSPKNMVGKLATVFFPGKQGAVYNVPITSVDVPTAQITVRYNGVFTTLNMESVMAVYDKSEASILSAVKSRLETAEYQAQLKAAWERVANMVGDIQKLVGKHVEFQMPGMTKQTAIVTQVVPATKSIHIKFANGTSLGLNHADSLNGILKIV